MLDVLVAHGRRADRLTHVQHLPERAGRQADWPAWADAALVAGYRSLGVTRPWTHQVQAADAASRDEVLLDLRRRGLLREGAPVPEQVEALHAFLTRTPAKLLGVSVSDLAGDKRVINQPGTDEEYPNWRVPLAGPEGHAVRLEELFTWRSARRLARTVDQGH